MGKRLTYEEVKEYIELQNYTLLSKEYYGTSIPIELKCPQNHIIKVRFNDFKNKGTRCRKCYDLNRKPYIRNYISNHEYYKKYIESFGYKVLSNNIINGKQKIHIECTNGHKFYKSFYNFKNGQRCMICNRNLLSYDEVKYKIELTGYKLLSKEYKNNRTPLKVMCPEGHIYKVKYDNFQQGKRCPECTSNSKGEDKINLYLKENNINYLRQYKFSDCFYKYPLHFDFAIFDKNNNLICLIEYQGKQHYEPIEWFGGVESFVNQQERDNTKRDYCKLKNIKLIEIPYWNFDRIEEILKSEVIIKLPNESQEAS